MGDPVAVLSKRTSLVPFNAMASVHLSISSSLDGIGGPAHAPPGPHDRDDVAQQGLAGPRRVGVEEEQGGGAREGRVGRTA